MKKQFSIQPAQRVSEKFQKAVAAKNETLNLLKFATMGPCCYTVRFEGGLKLA